MLIKEINDSSEPYKDHYGRITYFYIELAGHPLPIYQPGSIMFESAIVEDCDISVDHGGS